MSLLLIAGAVVWGAQAGSEMIVARLKAESDAAVADVEVSLNRVKQARRDASPLRECSEEKRREAEQRLAMAEKNFDEAHKRLIKAARLYAKVTGKK